MLSQQAAELFTRRGITECFIECAARHAARGRADTRAERIERFHRQTKAVAFVSDHVFRRHAALVESDLANRMRGDQWSAFNHTEALHLRANDEGRKRCASVFARAGARKHSVEISDSGVGDKTFAPVDDVGFTVAPRGGLDGGDVRASIWFSQRKRCDRFATRRARKPKLTYVIRRRTRDRERAESLHDKREIGE